MEQPRPTAGPLTLAMSGVSMVSSAFWITRSPLIARADAAGSALSSSSQLTSPPAENARPLPVRIATFVSSSRSMSRKRDSSSRCTSRLIALSWAGRLNVTVRMGPARTTSMAW